MSTMGITSQSTGFIDRHAERIAAIVIAVLVLTSIVIPRAIPFFFFALVIMAVSELLRTGQTGKLFVRPSHFWVLLVAFVIWCFLASLWSDVPLKALGKVVFLVSAAIGAWVILRWLSVADTKILTALKLGFFAGFLTGAIFLAIEIWFDQPLRRALYNNFDWSRPRSQKHVKFANDEVISLSRYLLNRSLATLNLFFWPALLIVVELFKAQLRWGLIAIMAALIAVATFFSVHESSMLALIAAALVFAMASLLPRLGRIALATGWIAAVLLIIPVINAAYKAELYNKPWMPITAQARLIFWKHTANEYLKSPVIGVGLRSTKVNDDAKRQDAEKLPNHAFAMRTGRHGHNIYLQTWYELGAIGALLLLVTGLALIARANHLANAAKPYVFAAFSAAAVIAAFTWGMWQVWYMALFAMTCAMTLIAASRLDRENE